LRITVNQEGSLFRNCQTCGEVYGGRCLPYSAFLVGDRDDF